jgi:hypothetical protein
MNQVARMKVFSLLLVMLLGTSFIAGCTSAPSPKTTQTNAPTLQGTTAPVSPVTASAVQPQISASVQKFEYMRGEDVIFTVFVQGGAKSFTITTYYLCVTDAPICPKPQSLHNTAGFTDKKVVPVNADSPFNAGIGTSAYKQGTYVAFLELPAGQYTSLMFIII